MRKYFIKDGDSKKGPFNLEQLKLEKINTNSPIWFEELGEWVTAGEVEELEDYFQSKSINNMFTGFATSNNFSQQIDSSNNYAVALNNHTVSHRSPMSLSILVYGLLILAALIILSKS